MGPSRAGTPHRAITGHADLPQHQVGRRIDAAAVEHELAGFVVLATDLARVDAEVGVQAVLGRDASFHLCFETFGARLGDGLVRNSGEHARSEEPTSELQSLMPISYPVFSLK